MACAFFGGKALRRLKTELPALYWAAITTNSWIKAFQFLDTCFVSASLVLVALQAFPHLAPRYRSCPGLCSREQKDAG